MMRVAVDDDVDSVDDDQYCGGDSRDDYEVVFAS